MLDIKTVGQTGKRYNIEIQITDETDYDKRALYDWTKRLSDWSLEDAKNIFSLFTKHIQNIYPLLSIILTEDYITAENRAGENFEYKGNTAKYLTDANGFLKMKAHPLMIETGIKLINVEVKSRDPWTVFKEDIEPIL